jgi:hypothetical protein
MNSTASDERIERQAEAEMRRPSGRPPAPSAAEPAQRFQAMGTFVWVLGLPREIELAK